MSSISSVLAVTLFIPFLAHGQTLDEAGRNRETIRQHHDRLNRGDVEAAVLDYAVDAKC